ncbi:DNA binding methylated-DNA--cysteine S-methyltransferase [Aspergillus japonicus CBS 114.51]|uniref:Methylated-DNA--protein-cysteine methyltransferase n=1 Tax=Aspergillus japonicus CBS 114.51 TaxID=1448312 RepID=A0A8T8WRM5_ASPJA|nr:DNA binding methylated-DNA--cysteine S-methyltransferase [Aspergillus japonicus CBS 114.51]RAH78518.1 DNA binding methylated-DNA--cysteine S-methyltransferase [Aspergillus japonicus CBS 114.51]
MSTPTTTTTTTTTPNPHPSPRSRTLHRLHTHPTLPPHRRRIYQTLLTVPAGRWTTYAALARHLGTSPRAIGAAMRLNPFAPEVPCHRVLGGGGRLLVGYSGAPGAGAPGKAKEGVGMKRRLLEAEGVRFDGEGVARGVCFVEFPEVVSSSSSLK